MTETIPLSPVNAPVGSRMLITERFRGSEYPQEILVLEWSPSGKRVKVRYATQSETGHSWLSEYNVERTIIVEHLPRTTAPETVFVTGVARLLNESYPVEGSSADTKELHAR